ncbi:MAG: hypothetical protein MJ095_03165 [Oscillospiraceae bacterium]|nr:hypothetical protein [Oscillospiraceae bacterium]
MDYKETAEYICSCFDEMSEVLLETENEINNLFVCSPDDVDVSVERIEKYREITDEIQNEINSACSEDESGELKKAVMPLTDRKDVAEEYVFVFEKRQEINAIIYRIQNAIPMVSERLKKTMEKTLEEIKENNTGQSAQAARYYSAVNATQQPSRLSQKSRSI